MITENLDANELIKPKQANSVKPSTVNAQDTNAEKKPREATGTSAPVTLPTGGTITYSKDGDTFENTSSTGKTIVSATQSSTQANSSASSGTIQTASGDSENSSSSSSSSSNSSNEANNMILQGYSDSKIKEKTGVSQQEIEKLRKKLESKNQTEL